MTTAFPLPPLIPRPVRIRRVARETHDVRTLYLDVSQLDLSEEHDLRRQSPGRFNMLYAFGVGEIPISISGDTEDSTTLVHSIRSVGAVSRALCEQKKGDVIGVRGPYGVGWPIELTQGKDLLLVAGGIGLAPLRPVIYWARRNREKLGRLSIACGARAPEEILFKKELHGWRGEFDVGLNLTVDRAGPDWRGQTGVVTTLLERLLFTPENTIAMVCGPEIMIRFTMRELERLGVGEDQVFISMERNMKCAIGLCGHCQFGADFVCRNGPVLRFDRVRPLIYRREI